MLRPYTRAMQKRVAVGTLSILILAVIASWSWYYLTRPEPLPRPMVRRVPAPAIIWRAASAKERGAAIRSIVAQLEAFKADRYDLAVTFQSSGLKRNFPSVDRFRSMMQTTYPQFARYKKASFGAARSASNGKVVEIPIVLTGEDGTTVKASYSMVLEEGAYRVSGVSGGMATGNNQEPQPNAPPGFEKIAPLVT
jgi:hypothetical protein